MTPLLDVDNLSVHFPTAQGVARAVDGVSFSLQPRETLGLVGESGSGKTVTALSLLKLVPEPGRIDPASRIVFEGTDIVTTEGEALRRIRGAQIAMIFQEPMTSLNPVLTVGSQIVETIRAHETATKQEAGDRAVELLRTVGIPEPERRVRSYPHQMSGGMLQRVMIAIALSCRPKILIADEPTTALDVTIQAQILDLLVELQERFDMAMLFITHDLGVLAGVADRVAVMYGGTIVEQGTVQDVFAAPAHPYTRGLLGAIPRVDRPRQQLAGIPGSVPTATAWPSGCRFHPRCAERLERCATDAPTENELGARHTTRCWLHVTAPVGDDA